MLHWRWRWKALHVDDAVEHEAGEDGSGYSESGGPPSG
jgi:hypothetical protein